MTETLDLLVDRLVGGRCPADPCASSNGVKTRVYAAVAGPPSVAAVVILSLPLGELVHGTAVAMAMAWVATTAFAIPRRINQMENCDNVDVHYGEEDDDE